MIFTSDVLWQPPNRASRKTVAMHTKPKALTGLTAVLTQMSCAQGNGRWQHHVCMCHSKHNPVAKGSNWWLVSCAAVCLCRVSPA